MEHKQVAEKVARGNEKTEQLGRKYKEKGKKMEMRKCGKRRGGCHTMGQVGLEGDSTSSREARKYGTADKKTA